jgi:phosphonate transport system substrate-binding protein
VANFSRGKKMRNKRRISFFLLTGFLFLCIGCERDVAYQKVDFSITLPVSRESDARSHERELRVAVAAMISPKETFIYYKELLDYIADRMEYRIHLIQRKTYEEINSLFPKNQIDLAFICSGPYATAKEVYGFEAIAVPSIRGTPFYQSYLIVHKNSHFQKLEDLRGHVFAFTDPDSNTGTLVPRFWLYKIGESADRFFSDTRFTFSHDNSILAVAKNLVDAASVDGHKWEYYNSRNPYFTSLTRVIKKSDPFGSPPLVANIHLPEALKSRIREIVLSMHETTEGRRIQDALMIDRFQAPNEEWYRPVREMYRAIHGHSEKSHAAQNS